MCCERKSWKLVDWWSDHQMLCWHAIIPLCFRMHRACFLNQTMAQTPFLKSNQSIFLSLLALGKINISNRYKQLHQKAVVMMMNSENVVVIFFFILSMSESNSFFLYQNLDIQQPTHDPDFMKHSQIAPLKNILFQTVQIPSLWLRLQHWNQSQMTHLSVIFSHLFQSFQYIVKICKHALRGLTIDPLKQKVWESFFIFTSRRSTFHVSFDYIYLKGSNK